MLHFLRNLVCRELVIAFRGHRGQNGSRISPFVSESPYRKMSPERNSRTVPHSSPAWPFSRARHRVSRNCRTIRLVASPSVLVYLESLHFHPFAGGQPPMTILLESVVRRDDIPAPCQLKALSVLRKEPFPGRVRREDAISDH
jgi:hypothetical protein